jgi:transcriptional regulator with XRE-family HTH domain
LFHTVLQSELDRRRARNPRYSLRAFANALRLDHSTLSQLLRAKRRATPRTIRRLGQVLQLDAATIDLHCAAEHDQLVLGVVRRPHFRADCRWIASQAGIPLDSVNLALHRLLAARKLVMRGPQWLIP